MTDTTDAGPITEREAIAALLVMSRMQGGMVCPLAYFERRPGDPEMVGYVLIETGQRVLDPAMIHPLFLRPHPLAADIHRWIWLDRDQRLRWRTYRDTGLMMHGGSLAPVGRIDRGLGAVVKP